MGAELKNTTKNSGGPFIWQLGNSCSSAGSGQEKNEYIGRVTCLGVFMGAELKNATKNSGGPFIWH